MRYVEDMTEKKRGRGRPPSEAGMTARVAVRTVPDDVELIEALAKKLPGFTPATLARAALRIGLTVLELDPSLVVPAVAPAAKRRAVLRSYFKSDDKAE